MSVSQNDIARYQALMQQGDAAGALAHLQALLKKHPYDRALGLNTAKLAQKLGRTDIAAACYERLLSGAALSAVDYFNIGYALKSLGRFDAAITAYQKSLDAGVDRPEEAHLNMGVIYADELHSAGKAVQAFDAARAANPALMGAYINLGNLFEETAQFEKAAAIYRQALIQMPNAYEAMARLMNASTITSADDPVLKQALIAAQSSSASDFDKECLHFALGTAFDALKDYERAFHHFTLANTHSLASSLPYNAKAMEGYVDAIISRYGALHFADARQNPGRNYNDSQPIFICGMFRSGSTLTEQILGAHPEITPLGELDFFAKFAGQRPGFYPDMAAKLNAAQRQAIGEEYLGQNAVSATKTPMVTDKRPDNALYLGFIKSVFPGAKVIHTSRNPVDNYLSLYFTQFGDGQAYARRLSDIQHYHGQHMRLMDHWRACFGEDIHDVYYDDCIKRPEATIKDALSFLGLNWTADVLSFHTQTNRVKTASYKQVRRPLYGSSSGRAQNYQAYFPLF